MSKQHNLLFPPTRWLESFARRKGKKLRVRQQQLVDNLLPSLLIDVPPGEMVFYPHALFSGSKQSVWLEIGYGGGEHLVALAKRYPQIGFVGCEPYINGTVKLLSQIETEHLTNIRLWDKDARLLLERFADHSLECIYILFPDPWPKARHHKRRIISEAMLLLLAQKIQKNGQLLIATDHVDYAEWISEHIEKQTFFTLQGDLHTPPADWTETRYQLKAKAEGREAQFFHLIRTSL